MNLVVKKSRVGLGAFASSPFKGGETVVDWSDHPLFADPPWIPIGWKFIEISPGIMTGPIGPENHPDAYINHSCNPSARILLQRPTILLVALRDIEVDEEITFDYATLYRKPWSMKCRCGDRNCRGTILGR